MVRFLQSSVFLEKIKYKPPTKYTAHNTLPLRNNTPKRQSSICSKLLVSTVHPCHFSETSWTCKKPGKRRSIVRATWIQIVLASRIAVRKLCRSTAVAREPNRSVKPVRVAPVGQSTGKPCCSTLSRTLTLGRERLAAAIVSSGVPSRSVEFEDLIVVGLYLR